MTTSTPPRALLWPRLAALICLVVAIALPRLARAITPNEIVLVLDNSGSMGSPWDFTYGQGERRRMAASDPERVAVLGALMLEGLVRGSTDRLSVVLLTRAEQAPPPVLRDAQELQAIRYDATTFFRGPLRAARRILDGAPAGSGKLLLFFTDGMPTDSNLQPEELSRILGYDQKSEVSAFVMGLFGYDPADQAGKAAEAQARRYLDKVAREPEDVQLLTSPRQVVGAFTRGYAGALGSRPETGKLAPGGSKTIDVGKYVIEVLVVTTSSDPGPDFEAKLTGPKGVSVARKGDNACPPGVCSTPRRHFEVFREANDPMQKSRYTLSIPRAGGDIEYGIILRYDLAAVLTAAPTAQAGQAVPVEAELRFQGKTFDDDEFFKADGFEVTGKVGGEAFALTNAGGGKFKGTFTAKPELSGATVPLKVVFRNTWLERHAAADVQIEGVVPLELRPVPSPLDVGNWRAERAPTTRCAQIDLSSSPGAERVELTCTPENVARGTTVLCEPVPASAAALPGGRGQPLAWRVCVTAPRCSGTLVCDEQAGPGTAVVLSGKAPLYADKKARVPLRYHVVGMGFLACWWPVFAGIAGVGALLFLIVGFVRPYSFDPQLSVRVAASEAGLRRTSALVLRELPGGQRGFYRNARVCVNGTGDFVRKPGLSVLVIEAGPGGTTRFAKAAGLERKDRRTGKLEAVPASELEQGPTPGVIYKLGGLYLKVE